jgi:hypothetical protein
VFFEELGLNFLFSVRTDPVYEQHAVQMIIFMLDNPREKPVGFNGNATAVFVFCLNRDTLRPYDILVKTGNAQTTLFIADRFCGSADNLGIDEYPVYTVIGAKNEDSAAQTDLRCSQTDTVGFLHEYQHLTRKSANFVIYFLNGNRFFPKNGVTQYVYCHTSKVPFWYLIVNMEETWMKCFNNFGSSPEPLTKGGEKANFRYANFHLRK